MEKIKGFVTLIRPATTASGMFATFVGAYLADPKEWKTVLVAVVVVGLLMAYGNAINDAHDADMDKVNAPHRPIPRGTFTVGGGYFISVALMLLGISIAWKLLDEKLCSFTALTAVILAVYAFKLKCVPIIDNIVVAGLSAASTLFGTYAAGNMQAALPLAAIILVGVFGREVFKDRLDYEGDLSCECRTTAVYLGLVWADTIFNIACMTTIILIAVSFLFLWGKFYLALPAIGLLVAAMLFSRYSAKKGDLIFANKLLKSGYFALLSAVLIVHIF